MVSSVFGLGLDRVCPRKVSPWPWPRIYFESSALALASKRCVSSTPRLLNSVKNLNQLGKQNHVSMAWIPGHAGVYGKEVTDYKAKSGSKLKMHGPEPFIAVPYASCVSTVKGWSTGRWKSMWNK